ncbi:MAG: hypothetical protein K6E78_08400 [Treponema sp.]|nr:hypothetical protein [Treponema sp.]
MEKRHGKNRRRNWNEQKKNTNNNNNRGNTGRLESQNESQKKAAKFRFLPQENPEQAAKKAKAIQEFKARENICPICNQQISDMSSAIAEKSSKKPVHFECVMAKLSESEKVGQNEKIAYIGQGRFGILYFENPRDQRHFEIKKIIDWEEKDTKPDWREEMSGLYSQVE